MRRKWPRPRRLPSETETLTIFLETRPRRDVGTSRDRDHAQPCNVGSVSAPTRATRLVDGSRGVALTEIEHIGIKR